MINENVVFLPGTLCDERMWHNQEKLFKGVYHGNLRTQDNIEDMVKDLDNIPFDDFILIGFSMGGYVAQEYALANPTRVKKLILTCTSLDGYPPKERAIIEKAMPFITPENFKGITDRRLKDYLYPTSYENTELKKLIQAMSGADAAEVYLRQLKATLDRKPLGDRARGFQCPILVVGGKEDKIVEYDVLKTATKAVPGAILVGVKESGHFVPLEKPREYNEILEGFCRA